MMRNIVHCRTNTWKRGRQIVHCSTYIVKRKLIKYLEEEGDKFLVVDVSVPVDIRLAYQFLVELYQVAGEYAIHLCLYTFTEHLKLFYMSPEPKLILR